MLETLLHFRNVDSTENINARLAGLIPKGIVKGGIVTPEANSLQVRIKGDGLSPYIFLAFASDGMVVREKHEEHVLPITAGITSVVCLRTKYVEARNGSIAQFEVIPLGAYDADPDKSLIRLCSVSVPVGAASVLPEHINMGFRDSIEGFKRRIVRDVVPTREDLPAVSGFPAIAEINFLGNDFSFGTSITVQGKSEEVSFPFVPSVNFSIAPPTAPGLSRQHPQQRHLVAAVQNPLTGVVTAITEQAHGFTSGQYVRITGSSAVQANQLWLVVNSPDTINFTIENNECIAPNHGYTTGLKVRTTYDDTDYFIIFVSQDSFKLAATYEDATNNIHITISGLDTYTCTPQVEKAFFFQAPLSTTAWSGVGGSAVANTVAALVTAKTSPGVLHSLTTGSIATISGATDPTFNGTFTVVSVLDSQTFTYSQSGYPTAVSGSGSIHKEGGFLPPYAVEIGDSATKTALNFEAAFRASSVGFNISINAIGSSLQLMAKDLGVIGNSYHITKEESELIVISDFSGGVDATPLVSNSDLLTGDIYVVLFGSTGTMELWGYDGTIFRNLTSAETATLLDFHRRSFFLNEKHVSENEKSALLGSVGTPSVSNRYVTQQDTSVMTLNTAAALTGADSVIPSGSNRFLTEARLRGERGEVDIESDLVEVPLTDGTNVWSLLVAKDNSGTTSENAIKYFNVVKTDSLNSPGGMIEYAQRDFTPLTVTNVVVARDAAPPVELNPSEHLTPLGTFPRLDADLLGLPNKMWVELTATPNNGDATLLFSKVVSERYRVPAADMLAMPQRILPAQVYSVENKASELRFNVGINVAGKVVEFPDNLFVASNIQEFLLQRVVGDKPTTVVDGFSINFEEHGSIIPFTNETLNKWTKYLLLLTPQGSIRLEHISLISSTPYSDSKVTDVSFPFSDGSYVFAAINVKSSGVLGTGIEDLRPEDLELYPYQISNSYASPIVCGDGSSSFGHFTGTDAHLRAMAFAPEGSRIILSLGAYSGKLIISKSHITLEGMGATLDNVTDTALVINANNTTLINLGFTNCSVAINIQNGADNYLLSNITYTPSVTTKVVAPSTYTFNAADILDNTKISLGSHNLLAGSKAKITTTGSLPLGIAEDTYYYVVNPEAETIELAESLNGTSITIVDGGSGVHTYGDGSTHTSKPNTFNVWTVTDGTNAVGVGDFNTANGIQQACDAAAPGDIINILSGTYSRFTISKNSLKLCGLGSVIIDGAASALPCITVEGDYNQFDNIIVKNVLTGISCTGKYNKFSSTVSFYEDVTTFIKMPATLDSKHYNYHPLVSGSVNEVTVGDGSISWGDYVGEDAINLAIQLESAGTKIRVFPGTYSALSVDKDDLVIEGAGASSIIAAIASNDDACISINNSADGVGTTISGFYLKAIGNDLEDYKTVGIKIDGNSNYLSNIKFEESDTPTLIHEYKRYVVASGFRNRFVLHTGAPTTYTSWTVGDGRNSFGDFNGLEGITQALNALPTTPNGTKGVIVASGLQADFSDVTYSFSEYDVHRYIYIESDLNKGCYRIIDWDSGTITIERDSGTFIDDTIVYWYLTSGSKVWVLPGRYLPFTISAERNDVELAAWGAGSDTLIVGDEPLVVEGNRCLIKGFRFVNGVTAVSLFGKDNTFEHNKYETTTRYSIDDAATGNKIYDAYESPDRTYVTVSTKPSRGDFVGTTEVAIQNALNMVADDEHINRVILGKGIWSISSTIEIPKDITLEGSGHATKLLGDGSIAALKLADDGNQTITGIFFKDFTNSITSDTNVKAIIYNNWLEDAPIDDALVDFIGTNREV